MFSQICFQFLIRDLKIKFLNCLSFQPYLLSKIKNSSLPLESRCLTVEEAIETQNINLICTVNQGKYSFVIMIITVATVTAK